MPVPPHVPTGHTAPLRPPGRRSWLAVGLLVALTTLPTIAVLAAGRSALHVPWRQHNNYRADGGPVVVTESGRSGGRGGSDERPERGGTPSLAPTRGVAVDRAARGTREEMCPTPTAGPAVAIGGGGDAGVGGGSGTGGFPGDPVEPAGGVPSAGGESGQSGGGSAPGSGGTGPVGAGSLPASGPVVGPSGAPASGSPGPVATSPSGSGSSGSGSSGSSPTPSSGSGSSAPTESGTAAPGSSFTGSIFDELHLRH